MISAEGQPWICYSMHVCGKFDEGCTVTPPSKLCKKHSDWFVAKNLNQFPKHSVGYVFLSWTVVDTVCNVNWIDDHVDSAGATSTQTLVVIGLWGRSFLATTINGLHDVEQGRESFARQVWTYPDNDWMNTGL